MLLSDRTDEQLMILYQKGVEEAFRAIYERHSGKIFGFLKSKIKNEEKAYDIFQEVFVKIHKSKHLYNETFPFLPWLFTITRHALVDEVRKSKNEKSSVPIEGLNLAIPEVESTPQLSEVLPHLSALPENQKRVLQMRFIEEKTFDEISLVLETSPMNARKLLSRGIQRIKQLVKEGEKP